MSLNSVGLNRRQVEGLIANTLKSLKMEVGREYSNILIRQGRARDVGSLSQVEQDMEAMCDAYGFVLSKAFARVIEANNKKVCDDVQKLLKES